MMDVNRSGIESTWRKGWVVFAVLAVLTAAEFVISLSVNNPWPILAIVALAKAGLIVYTFMRVTDLRILWRKEASE